MFRRLPIDVLMTLMVASACTFSSGQDSPDPYGGFVAPGEPLPAEEQLKKFHLPPGFEIQLVAAEPVVRKPINLAFDRRGRLLVSESVEYPFPTAEPAQRRDAIKALAAIDEQGRPGEVQEIATGLNIPIGVAGVGSDQLIFSIPNIYRYIDADGDGRPETHKQLYGPFGFQDTHGMCNGFRRWIDGWVYSCHGFANTSQVEGTDHASITMNSGNTYRMREDGSHIEYFTHGQVNPFGLCFDSLGNLYSADCHSLPIYALLRGAYYPSFGKPDDGLGYGPTMIGHLHGSTGIAGVVIYEAQQFPAEYRGTALIGNPVTGRINHDRLEFSGSTPKAVELPDFLSCDDPWFRPVDLRLGPDGALYIADFYTRIIAHYEVPLTHPRRERERGRVWRVVYRGPDGKTKSSPPRDFAAASEQSLIDDLADENLEVRLAATHELVDRRESAIQSKLLATLDHRQATARAHAMWALERMQALTAPTLARMSRDGDRLVRTHVMRILAERADWNAAEHDLRKLVVAGVTDSDANVRRAAAEALGRHPQGDQVSPLLEAWSAADPADTHLVHVLRIAIRDHLLAGGIYQTIGPMLEKNPDRTTMIADVSFGAPTEASAAFLLSRLQHGQVAADQVGRTIHHVVRYASAGELPQAIAQAFAFRTGDTGQQIVALRSLKRGCEERGVPAPEGLPQWGVELATRLLASADEPQVRAGIELGQELRSEAVFPLLKNLAGRDAKWPALRGPALSSCVLIDAPHSIGLMSSILIDSAEPMPLRQQAARDLAGLSQVEARDALVGSLASAPERLAVEIAAGLAGSDSGLSALLTAVSGGKASPGLLQEWIVNLRMKDRLNDEQKQQIAQLTSGLAAPDQRLRELVEQRRDAFHQSAPDLVRGRAVFTKQCGGCHRLEGQGTKIGPELDGIGQRGLERILEDVLNPNRNVDQAFRSSTVALQDGRTVVGLVLREDGEVLVMADQLGKEIRLPLAEIEERQITPLSPMPANVADLVPQNEFFDLIAYLLAQRTAPADAR